MKKCIYCKCELEDLKIIDFCDNCGKSAFGERMFEAILKNMSDAQSRGDLDQGRI